MSFKNCSIIIFLIIAIFAEYTNSVSETDYDDDLWEEYPIPLNKNQKYKEKIDEKSGRDPPKIFCKNNRTLCDKIENYPTIILNQLIHERLLIDNTETDDRSSLIQTTMDRDKSAPEPRQMCMPKKKVIRPRAGKTFLGNWKIIVNVDNYKQYVDYIKCERTEPAETTINSLKCVENYSYKHLLAAEEKNGVYELQLDYFKIPTCCQTVYA